MTIYTETLYLNLERVEQHLLRHKHAGHTILSIEVDEWLGVVFIRYTKDQSPPTKHNPCKQNQP